MIFFIVLTSKGIIDEQVPLLYIGISFCFSIQLRSVYFFNLQHVTLLVGRVHAIYFSCPCGVEILLNS